MLCRAVDVQLGWDSPGESLAGFLLVGMATKAVHASAAMRCCRLTGAARLFDGDLGNRAILFIFLTAIHYMDP